MVQRAVQKLIGFEVGAACYGYGYQLRLFKKLKGRKQR